MIYYQMRHASNTFSGVFLIYLVISAESLRVRESTYQFQRASISTMSRHDEQDTIRSQVLESANFRVHFSQDGGPFFNGTWPIINEADWESVRDLLELTTQLECVKKVQNNTFPSKVVYDPNSLKFTTSQKKAGHPRFSPIMGRRDIIGRWFRTLPLTSNDSKIIEDKNSKNHKAMESILTVRLLLSNLVFGIEQLVGGRIPRSIIPSCRLIFRSLNDVNVVNEETEKKNIWGQGLLDIDGNSFIGKISFSPHEVPLNAAEFIIVNPNVHNPKVAASAAEKAANSVRRKNESTKSKNSPTTIKNVVAAANHNPTNGTIHNTIKDLSRDNTTINGGRVETLQNSLVRTNSTDIVENLIGPITAEDVLARANAESSVIFLESASATAAYDAAYAFFREEDPNGCIVETAAFKSCFKAANDLGNCSIEQAQYMACKKRGIVGTEQYNLSRKPATRPGEFSPSDVFSFKTTSRSTSTMKQRQEKAKLLAQYCAEKSKSEAKSVKSSENDNVKAVISKEEYAREVSYYENTINGLLKSTDPAKGEYGKRSTSFLEIGSEMSTLTSSSTGPMKYGVNQMPIFYSQDRTTRSHGLPKSDSNIETDPFLSVVNYAKKRRYNRIVPALSLMESDSRAGEEPLDVYGKKYTKSVLNQGDCPTNGGVVLPGFGLPAMLPFPKPPLPFGFDMSSLLGLIVLCVIAMTAPQLIMQMIEKAAKVMLEVIPVVLNLVLNIGIPDVTDIMALINKMKQEIMDKIARMKAEIQLQIAQQLLKIEQMKLAIEFTIKQLEQIKIQIKLEIEAAIQLAREMRLAAIRLAKEIKLAIELEMKRIKLQIEMDMKRLKMEQLLNLLGPLELKCSNFEKIKPLAITNGVPMNLTMAAVMATTKACLPEFGMLPKLEGLKMNFNKCLTSVLKPSSGASLKEKQKCLSIQREMGQLNARKLAIETRLEASTVPELQAKVKSLKDDLKEKETEKQEVEKNVAAQIANTAEKTNEKIEALEKERDALKENLQEQFNELATLMAKVKGEEPPKGESVPLLPEEAPPFPSPNVTAIKAMQPPPFNVTVDWEALISVAATVTASSSGSGITSPQLNNILQVARMANVLSSEIGTKKEHKLTKDTKWFDSEATGGMDLGHNKLIKFWHGMRKLYGVGGPKDIHVPELLRQFLHSKDTFWEMLDNFNTPAKLAVGIEKMMDHGSRKPAVYGWIAAATKPPHWFELSWTKPQNVTRMRLRVFRPPDKTRIPQKQLENSATKSIVAEWTKKVNELDKKRKNCTSKCMLTKAKSIKVKGTQSKAAWKAGLCLEKCSKKANDDIAVLSTEYKKIPNTRKFGRKIADAHHIIERSASLKGKTWEKVTEIKVREFDKMWLEVDFPKAKRGTSRIRIRTLKAESPFGWRSVEVWGMRNIVVGSSIGNWTELSKNTAFGTGRGYGDPQFIRFREANAKLLSAAKRNGYHQDRYFGDDGGEKLFASNNFNNLHNITETTNITHLYTSTGNNGTEYILQNKSRSSASASMFAKEYVRSIQNRFERHDLPISSFSANASARWQEIQRSKLRKYQQTKLKHLLNLHSQGRLHEASHFANNSKALHEGYFNAIDNIFANAKQQGKESIDTSLEEDYGNRLGGEKGKVVTDLLQKHRNITYSTALKDLGTSFIEEKNLHLAKAQSYAMRNILEKLTKLEENQRNILDSDVSSWFNVNSDTNGEDSKVSTINGAERNGKAFSFLEWNDRLHHKYNIPKFKNVQPNRKKDDVIGHEIMTHAEIDTILIQLEERNNMAKGSSKRRIRNFATLSSDIVTERDAKSSASIKHLSDKLDRTFTKYTEKALQNIKNKNEQNIDLSFSNSENNIRSGGRQLLMVEKSEAVCLSATCKPMLKELVHKLTTMLGGIVSESLINTITPNLLATVTSKIRLPLTNFLSNRIAYGLGHSLSQSLSYSIPKIINQMLPNALHSSMTITLTHSLTRALTHTLTPTLLYTLGSNATEKHYCYLCQKEQKFCDKCHHSQRRMYTTMHYSNYYADYYSDYYSDYFAQLRERKEMLKKEEFNSHPLP